MDWLQQATLALVIERHLYQNGITAFRLEHSPLNFEIAVAVCLSG